MIQFMQRKPTMMNVFIYIVKHTDETAMAFITMMKEINKKINDQTLSDVIQSLNAKIKSGELSNDSESIKK